MRPQPGSTLYVAADSGAKAGARTMKALKGVGMPTFKNPSVRGNLFLLLRIAFPKSIEPETVEALRRLLPPPPAVSTEDHDVEVQSVVDIDPIASYSENQ